MLPHFCLLELVLLLALPQPVEAPVEDVLWPGLDRAAAVLGEELLQSGQAGRREDLVGNLGAALKVRAGVGGNF